MNHFQFSEVLPHCTAAVVDHGVISLKTKADNNRDVALPCIITHRYGIRILFNFTLKQNAILSL